MVLLFISRLPPGVIEESFQSIFFEPQSGRIDARCSSRKWNPVSSDGQRIAVIKIHEIQCEYFIITLGILLNYLEYFRITLEYFRITHFLYFHQFFIPGVFAQICQNFEKVEKVAETRMFL
jgi:hypothetical protein